jgi:hypothetical protein
MQDGARGCLIAACMLSCQGLIATGGPDGSSAADASSVDASSVADGGMAGDAGSGVITNVNSITKDGVTWTFSAAVPVGQFVNGDYYVVGPVTVTSISPTPQTAGKYENGSALNMPTKDGFSPFDVRICNPPTASNCYWFSATDRVYAPLNLSPGDSLVSSISLPDCNLDGGGTQCGKGFVCESPGVCEPPQIMRGGEIAGSPVASMSVLTVISASVPADTFRPSYCDRGQTLYYANNLQRNLLPSLTPPDPANTPTLATFEGYMRQPWVDLNPFLFDAPANYMPGYGREIAMAMSYVGLMLTLDFPADQKVNLTNYLVQYGIDLLGCLKAGYGWPAFGGHRSGRKMPIIFAGLLFNDSAMLNVSSAYPNQFGDDMQTVYVKDIPGGYTQAWNGANVIYGGHYGVEADGTPTSAGVYGPYEQLTPPNWPLLNGNDQLGEGYRRCCTSVSWIGEALAMRILGGQAAWNHPAFFDYADRWMDMPGTQTMTDAQCVQNILTTTGNDYSGGPQGQTQWILQGEFPQYTFIDDMWATYRLKY